MSSALRRSGRICQLNCCNDKGLLSLSKLNDSLSNSVPFLLISKNRRSFSSVDDVDTPISHKSNPSKTLDSQAGNYNNCTSSPPEPIPNRPLRGERRRPPPLYPSARQQNRQSTQFGLGKIENRLTEQRGGLEDSDFLEKFKLGFDRKSKREDENPITEESPNYSQSGGGKHDETTADAHSPPPEDADEIFKKMKETGLIPNAVAMLDGLCKDGLVQEAMKLFGLMREKGTIPEVIIYTAVVEGFSKAQKLDDAVRIFRKMQSNGVNPNAFSYGILIQGLYRGKRLDDAAEFCVEMLEAGHSPNVATFIGLLDGFCREKGLEEAHIMINTLREKGFFVNEKAVKEYLERKGPFLPLVWEAILGKKASQRSSSFS